MKKLAVDQDIYRQLDLGLNIPEVDTLEDGAISAEEQRRRSEGARMALETIGEPTPNPSLTPNGGLRQGREPEGESEGKPEWFDAYRQLRDMQIPWRVACYIAWSASPKISRQPKTQEELAQQVLGLTSDRVIATWRKKSPEIDEVIALLQSAPLLSHRADVFKALAISASDPDHRSNPDRKLFLELTGDYVPHAKLELSREGVEDLSEMSEEELRRVARKQPTPDPSLTPDGGLRQGREPEQESDDQAE